MDNVNSRRKLTILSGHLPSVKFQILVLNKFEPFSSELILLDLCINLGKSSIKKMIFYGQADRKGWPPPLPSGVLWFFLRGAFNFGLWLCTSWNQIWPKKKIFDPLFDRLAEWRWALQVVTDATMEPRMQWWEVHKICIFKPLHH